MNLTLSHCGNPMTNFDFLLSYLDFASFGEMAAVKLYEKYLKIAFFLLVVYNGF